MARDERIEAIFITADDQMQGTLGFSPLYPSRYGCRQTK